MPELPEVHTTVHGINKEVSGLTIRDVWTSYKSKFHTGKPNIKDPEYFKTFRKKCIGASITHAERIGKNVLIHLSNKKTILVHMKMTGHFLYGKYKKKGKKEQEWIAEESGALRDDPYNKYVRLVFTLSNGKHLAFSDLRKFGKVFIFDTKHSHAVEDLMHLGPDPLTREFTIKDFIHRLCTQPRKPVKQVLMDQHVISGIGNIYSDEMLWMAGIHPLSIPSAIPKPQFKKLFASMKKVLKQGINFGGDSDSDYRNIYGERGNFQHTHNTYRKTGKPCPKRACDGIIERIKVGGRSCHYCRTHQIHYS